MAMNESVCSTCCYRVFDIEQKTYWEILHGGDIRWPPVDYLVWRKDSSAAWCEFYFDVDYSANEGMIALPFFNEGKDEWMVLYRFPDTPWAEMALEEFISEDGGLGEMVNRWCYHDNLRCLYRTTIYAPDGQDMYHFDSNAPHTAAAGMSRFPHQALQFIS